MSGRGNIHMLNMTERESSFSILSLSIIIQLRKNIAFQTLRISQLFFSLPLTNPTKESRIAVNFGF